MPFIKQDLFELSLDDIASWYDENINSDKGIFATVPTLQRGLVWSYKLKDWHIPQVAKVFCEYPEMWGKTIAFFSRISECFEFQELLRNEGIICEVVTGSSNKDAQLEAFINGDVQVVANVSVLMEGFDLPELQSVFIRDASRLPCPAKKA